MLDVIKCHYGNYSFQVSSQVNGRVSFHMVESSSITERLNKCLDIYMVGDRDDRYTQADVQN